jgi:hypothetical protein
LESQEERSAADSSKVPAKERLGPQLHPPTGVRSEQAFRHGDVDGVSPREPPAGIMRTSGSKSMSRSTTSGVDVRHRARAVEHRVVAPAGVAAACPAGGPWWEKSIAVAGLGSTRAGRPWSSRREARTNGVSERRNSQERPDELPLMKQKWRVVAHHQGLHELEELVVGHIGKAAVDEQQPALGPVPFPQEVGLAPLVRRDEAQDTLNRAFAVVVPPYRMQDGADVTFRHER